MLKKVRKFFEILRLYPVRLVAISSFLLIMIVGIALTDGNPALIINLLWGAIDISFSESALIVLAIIFAIAAAGMIDVQWIKRKGSTELGLRNQEYLRRPKSEFLDAEGDIGVDVPRNGNEETTIEQEDADKDYE